MIKVDLTGALDFFDAAGPDYSLAAQAHRSLEDGTCPGSEFTGWLSLPGRMQSGELPAIVSAAKKIRSNSEALIVIGIGGSYLGARAAIELLRSPNHNALRRDPQVFFAGNGMSPEAINEIMEMLGDTDFSINVISKSGKTLEPALAFRVFRALLEKKYGIAGAKKRIFATTDASDGLLKTVADREGYQCFTVPDDVGGRFSVLSSVGLLPMAVAGIDVELLTAAAADELHDMDLRSPDNPVWQYAAARQHLYRKGYDIEILASFDPAFRYMSEWWKQLFGESEGKNNIGIFPSSVEYSADLHSMGQYIQDGPRRLIETMVRFEQASDSVKIPFLLGDADGLNYLAGHDLSDICKTTAQAVRQAHIAGGVPNIGITVPAKDEEGLAALLCFFELACAISGCMMGVNPFDQPGVEEYKRNMFDMLGNDRRQ